MNTDIGAYVAAAQRLRRDFGVAPDERFVTLSTGERVRVQELGDGPPFWAHALVRHTETLGNDTRSSSRLLTPLRGQNVDVHLGDDVFARLTMPVLLLWGEHAPNGRAATMGRLLAERYPMPSSSPFAVPSTPPGSTTCPRVSTTHGASSGPGGQRTERPR